LRLPKVLLPLSVVTTPSFSMSGGQGQWSGQGQGQGQGFSVTGTEEEFMLRELERGNTQHLPQHPPSATQQQQQTHGRNSSSSVASVGSHGSGSVSVSSTFEKDAIPKLNEKLHERERGEDPSVE
jgi:hypothetical protein